MVGEPVERAVPVGYHSDRIAAQGEVLLLSVSESSATVEEKACISANLARLLRAVGDYIEAVGTRIRSGEG